MQDGGSDHGRGFAWRYHAPPLYMIPLLFKLTCRSLVEHFGLSATTTEQNTCSAVVPRFESPIEPSHADVSSCTCVFSPVVISCHDGTGNGDVQCYVDGSLSTVHNKFWTTTTLRTGTTRCIWTASSTLATCRPNQFSISSRRFSHHGRPIRQQEIRVLGLRPVDG
ncbi:hypothetical protein AMAG_03570 [Allomyces macrogynus ATCC 38327]|uniref:Uncharacterized protein n=1 Tax=Allomyces macrogynus (strain ATCC 38327) TaxID=578462 RepID=A0A0L0SA33_ALLM3|nr:hypothetical protein AMAG_03570 [Allomyces macrogynus ATCC 38327]|eukprot:KNE59259.1 hypothetical protein AMAG_03570 [Allomyces macrogynus ATCC 38327]